MYRIRSASGNEVSYNSLEEFAAAVRRGDVHPEDQIFHTRANRWLDVKSHPHYRSATTWHGHEPAGASAPRAPVQSPSSSHAQVFERPQLRTASQTTVRPQLQPEPGPTSPSDPVSAQRAETAATVVAQPETPRRPKKSKELAFIDLGDSSPATRPPKGALVLPATPAPVPPEPEAKAEPKPTAEPKPASEAKPVAEVKPAAVKLVAEVKPTAVKPAAEVKPVAVKPAAGVNPAAEAKPVTPPAGPDSEVEFLVMDDGIDSPLRTSTGVKAIPEDLDLLFDAPLQQAPGQVPAPTRSVALVGIPPKSAPVHHSGKAPTTQAGPPAAPVESPPEAENRPAATAEARDQPVTTGSDSDTPPVDLTIPSGILVDPPVVAATATETPAAAAPHTPPPSGRNDGLPVDLTIPSGSLLDAPPTEVLQVPISQAPEPQAPASHAPASHVPAPQTPAPSGRREAPPVDMTIPSGALFDVPAARVRHVRVHRALTIPSLPGRSNGMMLGGGIALVAVVGTLLAWRPWQSGPSVAEATAQPAGPAKSPLVGAPAPTPIRTSTAASSAGRPGATSKPENAASGGKTDSVTEDGVIAVAKPKFRTDVGVPVGADLGVGPNVHGRSAGASASPRELADRLAAEEREAQRELVSQLSTVGFHNVLAPGRLGTASGVGAARTAWGSGADAIRQYRGRLARLEGAYEDSVLALQRGRRWSAEEMRIWASRQSLAEAAETSQLVDLMFSQVNEGLEILAALDGAYSIKGGSIAFKNATTTTRYTSIRGWVEQRTSSWADIPEGARPYSVTAILGALGDGFPAPR